MVRAIGPSIPSDQLDLLCSSDGGEGHPRLCVLEIVCLCVCEKESREICGVWELWDRTASEREFIWTRVPRGIISLHTELSLMVIFLLEEVTNKLQIAI